MKVLKLVLFLYIIGVVFSCKNNSETVALKNSEIIPNAIINNGNSNDNYEEVDANIEKISLEIDGMTCEIGCARTIQSKLSKVNGVKLAEVSFEDKMGVVEFDTSKVTQEQIVSIVEEIAGGDLYQVKGVKKTK